MDLISFEQLKLMEHTIGFEPNRVKGSKYKAYRNYFCAGSNEMKEFEDLITKGMAVRDIRSGYIYYFLTDKGINYLSEVTDVKIIEMD